MTVRRTFLQSLVGSSAYKRIVGASAAVSSKRGANPAAAVTRRRARFRPSTQQSASAPAFPRKIRIKRVSAPAEASATPKKPSVRKLPPAGPAVFPVPLKAVPSGGTGTVGTPIAPGSGAAAAAAVAAGAAGANTSTAAASNTNLQRALAFLRLNGPVLLLNFGSLCTLAGFTRTDVLELRIGNLIGNTCGMTYFIMNGLIPPFTWASVFGMTNAYNIYLILEERSDRVVLSGEEQALYEEHFLHHGVTPKQFKMIHDKSRVMTVPKGQIIIRANAPLDYVYLVVRGTTEASILGRHLTYASSLPGNSVRQKGGDSGAWIGEIAFLEKFWRREQLQRTKTKKRFGAKKTNVDEATDEQETRDGMDEDEDDDHDVRGRALHTIICTEDATLRMWSHEDLEEILKTSPDMRAAMTRSMTAAVVGKVVNFTVSRGREGERGGKDGQPTWSAWLQEGTASSSSKGEVRVTKQLTEEDAPNVVRTTEIVASASRRASPRDRIGKEDVTREDAIEAFRQVLLGQQAMDRSR